MVNNRKATNRGVLTIGNFDGVHIGHQHIIRSVLQLAQQKKTHSILYTFNPHPVTVLKPQKKLKRLCSLDHTLLLLKQMGLDRIIIKRFTKSFSTHSPLNFIKNYIAPLHPSVIVVGENFRFGADHKGSVQTLYDVSGLYRFEVQIVPPLKKTHHVVSSSLIRQLVVSGKWDLVNRLLGRPFSIRALVVKGTGRGKNLGFPTINLKPDEDVIKPIRGVYGGRVKIKDRIQPAIVNIGVCPTFLSKSTQLSNQKLKIEVHLIGICYQWTSPYCEVEILKYIRPEKKWTNPAELVRQIKTDIRQMS